MNYWKYVLFVSVPIIAILGSGAMYMLMYLKPQGGSTDGFYLLASVIITALGLFVPYWMLKAGFKGAEANDPHETSIELADLPKDHDQLVRHKP